MLSRYLFLLHSAESCLKLILTRILFTLLNCRFFLFFFSFMDWQDWWDEVKSQLEKPNMDKKMMRTLYDEMSTSLCNSTAPGIGSFRKKFSQVLSLRLFPH